MQHKLLNLEQTSVKFYEGKKGVFSGYASVFNGVDAYGDTIYPGAYKTTLENRQRPVQMRWNHYGEVIGKWTRIEEDNKGLLVEGELTPGHSKAEDVYASLMHGAISGLSIGYRVIKGMPNEKGGMDLYDIDLVEISVVETPADLAAQIGDIKSTIDECGSYKELEAILRESGWSKSNATWFVERCKRLNLGEPDKEQPVVEVPEVKQLTPEEVALAFKFLTLKEKT